VIHPEAVLVQPDPPKKFAYCSDTIYNPEMIPHIRECDLLYHEATFADNLQHKAAETMHSTTKEAARIALEAQVKKLLLGHFSARYKDLTPLIEEAQSIFPQTEAAKDGEIYIL
jgi:ribonuclease Z